MMNRIARIWHDLYQLNYTEIEYQLPLAVLTIFAFVVYSLLRQELPHVMCLHLYKEWKGKQRLWPQATQIISVQTDITNTHRIWCAVCRYSICSVIYFIFVHQSQIISDSILDRRFVDSLILISIQLIHFHYHFFFYCNYFSFFGQFCFRF